MTSQALNKHPKHLFEWKSTTDDLLPKNKYKKKKKKSQTDVEKWLDKIRLDTEESHSHQMEEIQDKHVSIKDADDDIDVWLKKVRMAADMAQNDVVQEIEKDNNFKLDVKSEFSEIVSNYIPDLNWDDKVHDANKNSDIEDVLLEDKFDTVTEARSILNSWLSQKNEIDKDQLWIDDSCEPIPRTSKIQNTTTATTYGEDTAIDDVTAVLNQLRAVPVEKTVIRKVKSEKRIKNPAESMAKRHDEAKKRRMKLEEDRIAKLKSAAGRKAARAEAEKILIAEKAEKERIQKIEEDKIQQEMATLRKRLAEEQQQRLNKYDRQVEEQTEEHRSLLAAQYREAVVQNAEQELQRKKLLSTRRILLQQLQEAEKQELKDRYKLLQSTFTTWREGVLDARVLYNKAVVYHQWKLQIRVWKCWRRYSRGLQEDRDERIRQDMLRENKNLRIAQLHYQKNTVGFYFKFWVCWTREQIRDKDEKMQEIKRKQLMENCLAAASELTNQMTKTHEEYDCDKYENKRKRKKKLAINFDNRSDIDKSKQDKVNVTRKIEGQNIPDLTEKRESNKQSKAEPEYYTAASAITPRSTNKKKSYNGTRSEHGSVPSVSGTIPPGSVPPTPVPSIPETRYNPWCTPIHSSQPVIERPRNSVTSKKVPAALQGMEERARQRKARLAEIEARKQEKMKAAELAKLEEKRQKERDEWERLRLEKERRFKEIEESREKERQRKAEIQRMRQNMVTATNHYHNKLKLNLVIKPLLNLCQKVSEDTSRAETQYNKNCVKQSWIAWREAVMVRELEKEEKAVQHHRKCLLRMHFNNLKRAISLQDTYTRLADRHFRRILKIQYIRYWYTQTQQNRVTREKLQDDAVQFNLRRMLRSYFNGWRKLTPILKRERQSEMRKNKLRNRIAELLPDYTPPLT